MHTMRHILTSQLKLRNEARAFGEIAVSGQTTVTPNTNVQTLTLVNGTGIAITTDNTAKEITVTNSDTGSSQDIIKSVIAVDTDAGLSFSGTGTYSVSGNTDSFIIQQRYI